MIRMNVGVVVEVLNMFEVAWLFSLLFPSTCSFGFCSLLFSLLQIHTLHVSA
jgi:hypothetical protein